jgi:hypothetical protein
MSWLLELHLIRFFSLYLTVMFCLSTYRRFHQYGIMVNLVRAVPDRWPHLFALVKQHGNIFLTWQMALPAALTLLLLLGNTLASHYVWPHADFTVAHLLELWHAIPVVVASGAAMVAFDVYGLMLVSEINRAEVEKYFNQAEYWLCSRTAHVVRVFTLGYVNPRKMVAEEVRKALIGASQLLHTTLWWTITQTSLRLAFGLSLWTTYALQPKSSATRTTPSSVAARVKPNERVSSSIGPFSARTSPAIRWTPHSRATAIRRLSKCRPSP